MHVHLIDVIKTYLLEARGGETVYAEHQCRGTYNGSRNKEDMVMDLYPKQGIRI